MTAPSDENILPKGCNFGHSYMCLECGNRTNYREPPEVIACAACGGEDVSWMPPKFASPSQVDQTLKRLAKNFGLSDMGQRGGTRAGEAVKRIPIQETPTQFHNVGGINVPVTNDVSTVWSSSTLPSRIKPNTAAPYGGIAKPRPIPTRVVAEGKA